MRVLRPLFHNSDNEETTAEAEALPATVEAPWNEEAPPQPEFNATQDSHRQKAFPTEHHPAEDDRKQPALPRKSKPSSPKRQFRNEEHSSKVSPKKKARAIPAKKPPPQPPTPVTTTTETTSDQESQLIMTAPKFLDEERQQEEVLENEPPEAARPAVASRNVHSDQADLDPALVSVAPQHDTFVQALKKKGLEIVEQDGDGNCLFRAISLQVYGDASMHGEVRARCMDFMALNEEHFGQFVTGETYTEYIARKRLDGVHGNNPEIQAMSEIYNRPVEVYTPDRGDEPLNIFHKEYSTADIPIRLSYHDGNHYNAVIDPIRPTAGLGLGLPGLQPGLADKKQMATAVIESDQQNDLEKAIQESQQDLDQTFDDDLQRAIKESSQSVSYVSCCNKPARPACTVYGTTTLTSIPSFCDNTDVPAESARLV